MPHPPTTPEACAEAVGEVFGSVIARLDAWRISLAASGGATKAAQLDALVEKLVLPELTADNPLLVGAGFIAAADYVRGRDVHFVWWLGPLEANPLFSQTTGPTRLDLHTRGYTEYLRDFRTLEWYSIPESTHRAHITGPYVDHLCTCDYILTNTMPVMADGRMIGVAGADVTVKRLEQELLPLFGALEHPVALLNSVGRVVISTEPALAVGELLAGGAPQIERILPCAGTQFRLAVLQGTTPR